MICLSAHGSAANLWVMVASQRIVEAIRAVSSVLSRPGEW
jgi:hypothetical protein